MISDRSAVGLGKQRVAVLAEAVDHRQQPAVGRELALVELVDVGVDRLDVLAQPLSLGQQAAGCVKCPDDQGAPSLEVTEDLDCDPIDGPLDAADELGAVAPNRDGLPEHGRGGHDDLGRPPHIQLDQLRSRHRLQWRLARPQSGTHSGRAGAEVIVGAKVGANDPAAATVAGGLALWSRS